MAKKTSPSSLERALEALSVVDGTSPAGVAALRAGLLSSHSAVVARAATLIQEQVLSGFAPELLGAYDRFFSVADPGCRAKQAIASALDHAEHPDPTPFLRGIPHIQKDAAWGPPVDVATALRSRCAFALARLNYEGALDLFADRLADPEVAVRVAAAQAIVFLGDRSGTPLLRLKLHHGDKEPEVMGECLTALCRLDPTAGVAFAQALLDGPSASMREVAAFALGETRLAEAFAALKAWYERRVLSTDKRLALLAVGVLRLPEAVAFLLERVERGDVTEARQAVAGLAPNRFQPGLQERAQAAAARNRRVDLSAELVEHLSVE